MADSSNATTLALPLPPPPAAASPPILILLLLLLLLFRTLEPDCVRNQANHGGSETLAGS